MKIRIVLASFIVLLVFQSSCDLSNFLLGMTSSSKSQNKISVSVPSSKNDKKNVESKHQQFITVPSDKEDTLYVLLPNDTYLTFLNTIIQVLMLVVAVMGIFVWIKSRDYSRELKEWKDTKKEFLEKNDVLAKRVNEIESQNKIIKPLEKIFQPGIQFDFLIRGNDALKNQNYINAELLFRQSLLLEGESIQAWVGLAQAFRGLEKLDESLKTIDLALDMDKRNQKFDGEGNISILKMEILDEMGKKDEASIIAAEVLKKNPYSKKAKKIIDSVKKPKKKK